MIGQNAAMALLWIIVPLGLVLPFLAAWQVRSARKRLDAFSRQVDQARSRLLALHADAQRIDKAARAAAFR
jgi:hypothetical protein